MTVIIHSLADAALADGPTVIRPPISTLMPAASLPTRASRSSPPKLSSRDQTLLSPPSVKGWSSVTFSSDDTTTPFMLPGSHTVHRSIEAQIHPLTQVTNQHMPLEYSVRRCSHANSSDHPASSSQPQPACRNTTPVLPTSKPFSRREKGPIEWPTLMPQPHTEVQLHRWCPLQRLQLDKRYPKWSIHGWHEDAQRLLQSPQALTPSNVYVKLRPISRGAYSSGSQFDKSSRAHPPPGWGENMDSTSQTFASPSLQAKTLHPLPLRPINSEVKPSERSYGFIMYGTELTEQENHAMARALDTGKESNGSRTNDGRSPLGKTRSIAFAPNSLAVIPPKVSYHARKTSGHLPLPDRPPTILLLSPVAPKAAAFEEDELDSTSSSSSCSSELSEYEEKSGEDFPLKLRLRLKVSPLSSILGSSSIKSIGSENITPSSSNYTPTNDTKRARTLNSTSTSSPMPLSSWGEEMRKWSGQGLYQR
ncbi:uncharacterized protein IAS62_003596 [Cryptococcus decagattii]|uniref:Uncharacterized protein n=1 Tax=Cryptococcus decagattii TaxID=1859122 RepID=A0ABZ2AY39_9TREE